MSHAPDNTNQTLRLAVIGAGDVASRVAPALRDVTGLTLVGVSDRNATAAERLAASLNVPAFSDNRSMLAQTRPQAVYLAVPPAAVAEAVGACAKRGIHVWQEAPLARSLDEGLAMAERMDAAGLKYVIATRRRFSAGYRQAQHWLDKLGPLFLARCTYLFNWGPQLGWRGDREGAGGGALLDMGYHCLDLLVWTLGLPEDVFGVCAQGRRPVPPDLASPLPVYDTEDTAAAILRYGKKCLATLTTTRNSGPASDSLHIHGQGGSVTANDDGAVLRDPEGNVLDQRREQPSHQATVRRGAVALVETINAGTNRYECSARENLLTLALIESIYLSDRTNHPESPARLLKTRGLSIDDCLRHRPGN
jgi:predicted dehydrogenase